MNRNLNDLLQPVEHAPLPSAQLGLRWSPIEPADGRQLLRLVEVCNDHDQSLESFSQNDIADLLEEAREHIIQDVVVGRDSEGIIRAMGSVEVVVSRQTAAQATVNAFIHPQWRGRGVGRALLRWQDARARQIITGHYGPQAHVDVRVSNMVDAHLNDRRRLYMAAGFSPIRTFQTMYKDLTSGEPEVFGVPEGFQVVNWEGNTNDKVRALHTRVFKDHWGSEVDAEAWWDDARRTMEKRWSYVAFSPEGELAGYLLVSRHPAQWIRTGIREAYAELLGVAPEFQGHGIARALLTQSIHAAWQSKMARYGLDVDKENAHGAMAFYERHGFVPAGARVFYSLDV
ncbi:GNAT family N-acetyltransferase [Gleimia hominis]|uniref:GNAT family N-acetyltransferase n=1 Tax=Gleimia hominis TaxID=595468 RepID=A0ABU3IBJ1_9ACTO|nr:GNAT family N-acetyltransferase [Gleimia hominis]MDT3767743.1 GNAT family N-acetyltransferase [Gleimia hominis]